MFLSLSHSHTHAHTHTHTHTHSPARLHFCSFSVAIKMNCLLFAPGLAVVYFLQLGFAKTILNLFVCAAVQVHSTLHREKNQRIHYFLFSPQSQTHTHFSFFCSFFFSFYIPHYIGGEKALFSFLTPITNTHTHTHTHTHTQFVSVPFSFHFSLFCIFSSFFHNKHTHTHTPPQFHPYKFLDCSLVPLRSCQRSRLSFACL